MTPISEIILVDLNQAYGLIAVSGLDAKTFLQGQLTCDVTEITSMKSGLGAYCNIKGRIIALFRIFMIAEDYFLQLPLGVLATTLTQLKKHALFSKVAIENVTEKWYRLGIVFPATALIDFPTDNTFKSAILSLPGTYPRFEWIIPIHSVDHAKQLFENCSEKFKNLNYRDFELWKLLDIQAGIPEIWPETTEQLLPHSLNLPALGAVSFNKGCYRGQEIVARMEYRAKLKRQLFQITLDTNKVPSPGTKLYASGSEENEVIGTVVSASLASIDTVEMLIEAVDKNVRIEPFGCYT